jgi:hypothetical protein
MTTTLTTKETRARLKAAIKAQTEHSREVRAQKHEAKAIGDTDDVNSLHWERIDDLRPKARAMFIAYGYLKGRTYRQVENKTRAGNEPDDHGYQYLDGWDGEDDADIGAWIEAGDKTRYEIEAAHVAQKPTEMPEKAPEPEPAPKGLLGRLRAAVGA